MTSKISLITLATLILTSCVDLPASDPGRTDAPPISKLRIVTDPRTGCMRVTGLETHYTTGCKITELKPQQKD